MSLQTICSAVGVLSGEAGKTPLIGWPNSAVSGLKLPPERSVLKLRLGQTIQLKRDDFVRLAATFFEELKKKYS